MRDNIKMSTADLLQAQLVRRCADTWNPPTVSTRPRYFGFVDGWVLVAVVATFCLILAWGGRP